MKAFFSKIWKWIVANKVISAVIGGAAVVAITLAIVLPLSLHKHKFETSWSFDESKHWHAATCRHDVKDSEAEHTFSEWKVYSADDSKDERSCSVCGYEEFRTHQHTNASEWNMDYEKHWHESSCGHSSQISSLGNHSDEFEVVGQLDHEYRVYKVTCVCGMVIYKFYELNSSNVEVGEPYVYKIKELVMPTVENAGKIVYYPDTPSVTETLIVPKVGGNRRVTWMGEERYDRAYVVSQEAGHYFAKINIDAFIYDGDTYNEILAYMLYFDPAWKFEISHDVYLGSRYVQGNGFVKTDPTLTTPGVLRFVYLDLSTQDFPIPALSSTANWKTVHKNAGDYTDEKDVYTFKEDAAYFSEISDEYLRWEYGFVMCDEEYTYYDIVNPSNLADCTGLETRCDDNGAYSHTDDHVYFAASVKYGLLEVGDYIYFETQFDENYLPVSTSDPSSVEQGLVVGIYEYADDVCEAVCDGELVPVTSGQIYADYNMYIIEIDYACGASEEVLFHNDLNSILFSGTSAAHLYTMYLGQDYDA